MYVTDPDRAKALSTEKLGHEADPRRTLVEAGALGGGRSRRGLPRGADGHVELVRAAKDTRYGSAARRLGLPVFSLMQRR